MSHAYMAKPIEIAYINGGEIYKAANKQDVVDNYEWDEFAPPIFEWKKKTGKRYYFTKDFKAKFPPDDYPEGVDLAGYDLCPDVKLWICSAFIAHSPENFDLFFWAHSSNMLRDVALYYELPYPVDDELSAMIDDYPERGSLWTCGNDEIIFGGVQFKDGEPSLLKLYIYPRDYENAHAYMTGHSYHNRGVEREWGAIYHKFSGGRFMDKWAMRGEGNYMKGERIIGQLADGTKTEHFLNNVASGGDPIVHWASNENGRLKRFESTRQFRLMQTGGALNSGTDLGDWDLSPRVALWLGRSWYEDGGEIELYFRSEDSEMLREVSEYYKLEVPFSDEQAVQLDTDPASMRMRNYDVTGRGEGNFLPVVVAGVVFNGTEPVEMRLYEFIRT
jgi:hypothetical protein